GAARPPGAPSPSPRPLGAAAVSQTASSAAARPADALSRTTAEEHKRIAPRSPRAALEPEPVSVPNRRSKRARNPLVIVGNAVVSALILAALAGGVALAIGKHRFEAPGPLEEDKVVN